MPSKKEAPLLMPGLPVEFKSSSGKKLSGVLVEEDALYEAWHVRLRDKVQFPALGHGVFTDLVSVMKYDIQPTEYPIVPVRISTVVWTCPHCEFENRLVQASALAVMSLTCSACSKCAEGVLLDANNDILREGQPFPE